jgi:aspartyl-tRNA(Asn)/glutamyl-tRNA(Gln) amidotransferase subunit A
MVSLPDGLTIHGASELLRRRDISSVELTRAVLDRVASVEERVGAFVTVTDELALHQAAEADKIISSGNAGPLTGVPGVIKDNMCLAGIRTTCSSKILENFVPPYTGTAVQRLIDAGIVVVGKSNMDEFAMGSSTENSAFHTTQNPWDLQYVPGGSSGGSAAAVAAGEGIFALGSDTGGSIRQPASFCGVVGMKPTYGMVSRYGLVAFASSLDQIGPLTVDVTDSALVLNAIAGYDPADSTSLKREIPDYTKALDENVTGLRVGVVKEMMAEGIEPSVSEAVRVAARVLERAGATIDWDASLPSTKYALAVYYILAPSEASSNLARYDGVKYGYSWEGEGTIWDGMERTRQDGFGPEVKRRIFLGTYALSAGYYNAFYKKAQQVRTLIRQEFEEAFTRYDVLLTPASPTAPFKIGAKADDPVAMYLNDICTIPVNIAGVPAISLPCGFTEDGLPIGLQLIGPSLGEETLFRAAHAYEQATGWHLKRAAL